MELKTHKELYDELKKEPHGQLAKMAADFVLQLREAREERDRQYEFNAGQIAKFAKLESEREQMLEALREYEKTACEYSDEIAMLKAEMAKLKQVP